MSTNGSALPMIIWLLVCLLLCSSVPITKAVDDSTPSSRADDTFLFGWNSYRGLKAKPELNVALSPNRIRNSLCMLMLGSNGTTPQDILNAFHEPEDDIPALIGRLHAETTKLTTDPNFKYEIASRFFVADAIFDKINPQFATDLAKYFDVKLVSAQFETEPEGVIDGIDKFVAENTDGEIPQFLAIDLPPTTKVVLINAVYMKGLWSNAFNASNLPLKSVFHTPSGDVQTEFMELPNGTTLKYGECANKECQLAVLPYSPENKFILVVVLPTDSMSLEAWENALQPEDVRSVWMNATDEKVHLRMPKFTLDTHFSLKTMLANLNATQIFGEAGAKNSLIFTEDEGVLVDDIISEAKIEVNEEGVAPAASIQLTGDEDIKSVQLNRPFLFFMADVSTPSNFVHYWGRVANPTKSN